MSDRKSFEGMLTYIFLDTTLIGRLFELVRQFLSVPIEEGEINTIVTEATDLLIVALEIFYQTSDQQSLLLVQLLNSNSQSLLPTNSSIRTHIIESVMLALSGKITHLHAINSATKAPT